MYQANQKIKKESVQSLDGTVISYHVMGEGPGLLIVHGGFRASQHYIRLGDSLSDDYTVYIMDRRGRNNSGPKGSGYSVQKECEDVIAILQKHQVSYLFGHSYGGLISLHVTLQEPIKKLAVYEPSLIGYFPSDWIPRFEQELNQNDYISASTTLLKGLQMGGVIGKLPQPVLKNLFRSMAKGPEWEENIKLLRTLPEELRAGLRLKPTIQTYEQISIPTMVMAGSKSPRFLRTAAHELSLILPNKQNVILSLAGLDHNAPDEKAPAKIAQTLKYFFIE
ncbi:alpha/beta fold hydrolase [Desmospora activa]|uniref:Pimeloyl-ACP methyl ester carboxylesterase n=1 Tax=Desmospora activa DSM 45169 TaxID=1121389 RepID=A0A2T4Z8G0_9BACL|nr:alpha/beta hydrolase [Desmospora activa]PTM58179.1 pimeloyl-ACP methyl ester carboxylesterase [Desmospora activa DSM 45169]